MATPGVDYTAPATLQVLIAAGQTQATLEFPVIDDNLIEGMETVEIELLSVVGDEDITFNPSASTATAELADDETGLVSISADRNGEEAGQGGRFRIDLDGVVDQDVIVQYSVTGSATPGQDFVALSGEATILADTSTAFIDVVIEDDELFEGSETIVVTLTSVTGDPRVSLDSQASAAEILILDDDIVTVSVDGATSVEENAGTAVFTVRLDRASSSPLTIAYSVAGTTTAGDDYTAPSGLAMIPAGATSAEIVVSLIDDNLVEGDETLSVELTSIQGQPDGVQLDDAEREFTTTITDDDSAQVRLTGPVTVTEGAASTASLTITMTSPSSTDTTIALATSGSATAGVDFVALNGTVTLPAGTTTLLVPLAILDDPDVEPTDQLTITLTSIVTGNSAITLDDQQDAVTLEIVDNDQAFVEFSSATSSVLEAAGESLIPVRLSIPSGGVLQGGVSADVVVTGGTATDQDFVLNTTTVQFPVGSGDGATVMVSISLVEDEVLEDAETVQLQLESISGPPGAAAGATTQHVLSITDDPLTASISGEIWSDADRDGVRDAHEAAAPGVLLVLRGTDLQGQSVEAQTYSDAQGRYRFTNLPGGEYSIEEEQPLIYGEGAEIVGSSGGNGVSNGFTNIVLEPAEAATGYHFAEGPLHAKYINARLFRARALPLSGQAMPLTAAAQNAASQTQAASMMLREAAPSYRRIADEVLITLPATAAETVEVLPASVGNATEPERTQHEIRFASGLMWQFTASQVTTLEFIGAGSNDQLILHDTLQDDQVQAAGNQLTASLGNGSYLVEASDFAVIRTIASDGDDELDAGLIDFVLEQEGEWR